MDPLNTSRQGHVAKANRKTQSRFQCVSCGHVANADTNAAINIAAKADVMRPIVMRATLGTDAGSPALAGGS
ncbi:MAG TPA: zinc ribbon domain-containing protein [Candidatus Competibacter sp.]|nr:zinc ribbon domain-containing protein [Candidatus Competibacter sp.]